jgi:hypothetical protein
MPRTLQRVLLCPAGEMTHGTLSLNQDDVRCRVSGLLRDAEGSPCCGNYGKCPIWRIEKEKVWALGLHRSNQSDTMIKTDGSGWA